SSSAATRRPCRTSTAVSPTSSARRRSSSVSVYLHVTLEIHAAGLSRFLTAMEETAVPFLERQGWRLAGAFVQRSGRLGNVIDVWELDDFQHYDRALQALR